jgi:pyruvate-formate lyase-activating enzyme
MLVHAIMPASRVNGPGLRCVVFVQGCTLGCSKCWNNASHPFRGTELAICNLKHKMAVTATLCFLPAGSDQRFMLPNDICGQEVR